ncbi:MAG: hypothetical protein M1819_001578 [Sarea resinae]|nr:MAG: hypothetical protein M1819_001578 [Sarea resinae]
MASLVQVANETRSTSTRMTKEGKKLTYKLNVIQQPARARACGSGAKSSADRRPVDPPPIVELRILEGDAMNDITFSHNANFFLFATLENARPIAQGRVPVTSASFPVLTGMPVAGIAYLDRPSPAGYFIFPDLSVRHEGKYRLSFNLYEEVKEPKDADVNSPVQHVDAASNHKMPGPIAPNAHVYWRLEVKSAPFTVFSAKKFPGLAESTALSRIVAEQGCRVRIRRDVRMRRREGKVAKEWDNYEEENAYVRERRTVTPDNYSQASVHNPPPPMMEGGERPRSVSNGSVDGSPAYGMPQRRPTLQDSSPYAPQHYQQSYAPAPVTQAPSNGYSSHLAFGNSSGIQYQAPQYAAPQPVSHPQQAYQSGHMNYVHQPSPHLRQMSNPQAYGYSPNQQVPQPQYPQASTARQDEYKPLTDYRRASAPNTQSHPGHNVGLYAADDGGYNGRNYTQQYPTSALASKPPQPTISSNAHALPPLKTLQPPVEAKYESNPSTNAMPGIIAPALSSPAYEKSGFYAQYPTPASAAPTRSGKRDFGSVFSTAHFDQPLQSGMRPSSAHHGQDRIQPDYDEGDFDSSFEIEQLKMRYKRADGTEISRRVPSAG